MIRQATTGVAIVDPTATARHVLVGAPPVDDLARAGRTTDGHAATTLLEARHRAVPLPTRIARGATSPTAMTVLPVETLMENGARDQCAPATVMVAPRVTVTAIRVRLVLGTVMVVLSAQGTAMRALNALTIDQTGEIARPGLSAPMVPAVRNAVVVPTADQTAGEEATISVSGPRAERQRAEIVTPVNASLKRIATLSASGRFVHSTKRRRFLTVSRRKC